MRTFSSIENTKSLLKKVQAVCFDVDSTVINEEGIDVLAEYKGVGEKVVELTKKAMGGSVKFEDALQDRLALINPSMNDVTDCLKKHPFKLTPGVDVFINKLHSKGVAVYLVSGGVRQMINPIARVLSIPNHRIYANNLLFNSDGSFKGFESFNRAIDYLLDQGIVPGDLHANNLMIRSSTGDIVFSDLGHFELK
jgi:phosphoserine phosphatase